MSSNKLFKFKLLSIFLILILMMVKKIHTYSSGAPTSQKVCTTMIPGHGENQKNLKSPPYKLNVLINNDDESKIIVVELEAIEHNTFAGFMIQSRKFNNNNNNNDVINDDGYFEIISNNTITKSCLSQIQNTWTHSNGEPKTFVQSKWITNYHQNKKFNDSFYFQATVVQVKQIYWNEIRSELIHFYNGKYIDNDNYNKLIDSGQIINNNKNDDNNNNDNDNDNQIDYNNCHNRLCIGLPNSDDDGNCIESKSCLALLSVGKNNDDDENTFSLQAKPSPSSTNKYYSMALSDDNRMGNDFVIDCLFDKNEMVKLELSHNIRKTNEPLIKNEKNTILKEQRTKYINGIVECNWKFKKNRFHIGNKHYDIDNNSYFIFIASGTYDNNDNKKDYHDEKLRTSESINFSSIKIGNQLYSKDLNILIRLHGSLMLIAWFFLVPIAITLARYFKTAWSGRLLCGVQIWFAFHRSFMVLSICLMIIAQISIFYYLGEYRLGPHQILGSIAFTLAILQPIGAIFRPHPGTSKRWIFNWAHWFGGNAGQITSAAAILLASKLKLANLNDTFLYIAIVWILCHVLLHLLFQFHSVCTKSSSSNTSPITNGGLKSSDIAMQNLHNYHHHHHNNNNNYPQHPQQQQQQQQKSTSSLKYILLIIYIMLLLLILIILLMSIISPSMMKKFI